MGICSGSGLGGQGERTSGEEKAEMLELIGQNYLKAKHDMSLKEPEPCSEMEVAPRERERCYLWNLLIDA